MSASAKPEGHNHQAAMDQLHADLSEYVPHLRNTLILQGCGHWTQQERPQEVTAAMLEFLKSL